MRSFTKRLSILFLFQILFVSNLLAERVWTPENGVPIRKGSHLDFNGNSAQDEDGNILLVWADTRSGDYDIYGQLFDSDGNEQWDENGKRLVSAALAQYQPYVIPDGSGNWIISWVDYRDDDIGYFNTNIYAQKINPSGEELWTPENGVAISSGIHHHFWTTQVSDNNGGAIFLWSDELYPEVDIIAQRVDSNGTTLWGEDGIIAAGRQSNQGSFDFVADGTGGIVLAWFSTPSRTTNVNRINSQGELIWEDDVAGMVISSTSQTYIYNINVISDGNNGFFFSWQGSSEIYAQHLSMDGDINWDNGGVLICSDPLDIELADIINSDQDKMFVLYSKGYASDKELYLQLIGNNGDTPEYILGDNQNGIPVYEEYYDRYSISTKRDQNSGIIVSWSAILENSTPIFSQRIDDSGSFLWNSGDPLLVCDTPLEKNHITSWTFNDQLSIFWSDYRGGNSSIYKQYIDYDENVLFEQNGEAVTSGLTYSAYEPDIVLSDENSAFIAWRDRRYSGYGNAGFVQKINLATGEQVWEEGGIDLAPGYLDYSSDYNSEQFPNYSFASDGSNGLIATWEQHENDEASRIHAQRINENGELLWGDFGVEIANDPSLDDQRNPLVIPGNEGQYFIAYNQTTETFSYEARIQKIDENGNALWSENGIPGIPVVLRGDEDIDIADLTLLEDGSLVVIFSGYVTPNSSERTLQAQRITEDGTRVWDTPVSFNHDLSPRYSEIIQLNNDDLIVLWSSTQFNPIEKNIYGQRITPEGSILWDEEGLLLCNSDPHTSIFCSTYDIENYPDQFWLSWQMEQPNDYAIITIQKFNVDGEPLLSDQNGIQIYDSGNHRKRQQICQDNLGGIFVIWDPRSDDGSYLNLVYTHLDSEGSFYPPYENSPAILSDEPMNKNIAQVVQHPTEGFLAVWQDYRSSILIGAEGRQNSDIYAQYVTDEYSGVDGNSSNEIPLEFSIESIYPNPFNPTTKITVSLPEISNLSVKIFNVLGQEVAILSNRTLAAGTHSFIFDANEVTSHSSGVYFVKASVEGKFHQVQKIVLMK
jgi:Secretion system C-terminal sorting domain